MMNWVIMPYVGNHNQTEQAVYDVLDQSLPNVHLLLIQQGGDPVPIISIETPRVHRWKHDPPLPSLSATWNRALKMVWEAGGSHALVVNNDLRLWQGTYDYLLRTQQATDGLFVTATGVTKEQFDVFCADGTLPLAGMPDYPLPGPDFSCFLITRECHEKYQFDPGYTPAYCEDLSYHRELMLGGDGGRIFGTGLPFLHVGSGTLQAMSTERRQHWEQRIEQGSRQHHVLKWGGGANGERFSRPFDPSSDRDGVTTSELFSRVRWGHLPLGSDENGTRGGAGYTTTPDSPVPD